jgi:hypothetical protein
MYNPVGLALMYNPFGPWNAWFALSSQAARGWTDAWRGMAQGFARVGAETGSMVTKNDGAAEAENSEASRESNSSKRNHNGGSAIAARRNRRMRHSVRSSRVDRRVKRNAKRKPSSVRQKRTAAR